MPFKRVVKLLPHNGTIFTCKNCGRRLASGEDVVRGAGRMTFRRCIKRGDPHKQEGMIKNNFYKCMECGRALNII